MRHFLGEMTCGIVAEEGVYGGEEADEPGHPLVGPTAGVLDLGEDKGGRVLRGHNAENDEDA